MEKRVYALFFIVSFFLISCVTTSPPGNPQTGFTISGYVGKTPTVPAPGETVLLIDGRSQQTIESAVSNFFGKYTFKGLLAGHYIIRVGKVNRDIFLRSDDIRLDIDLSAPDGKMDYMGHQLKEVEKKPGGVKASPTGPNDQRLAAQIAGIWWGYSGSTERKIGLCPDGSYHDFSESGYSGRMHDSGGYQTGAWGAAGQRGGSGTWTIQGDTQQGTIYVRYNNGKETTLQYRQFGDVGCLLFNGNKLCRSSANCN